MEASHSAFLIMSVLVTELWVMGWAGLAQQRKLVEALFIFGDSLVDVGNNNFLPKSHMKVNFSPYGIDFPHSKATGRFSNGLNAADFMAQKLGLGKLSPPPYLSIRKIRSMKNFVGANFASGGAGILNQTNGGETQVISLSQQVDYFMHIHRQLRSVVGRKKAQELLKKKSLFVFVIGNNDIFAYSRVSKEQTTSATYIGLLVTTLSSHLQKLYHAGARKLVFLGIGNMGCAPSQRLLNKQTVGDCLKEENELALGFNIRVYEMLWNMSSELPGFKFSFGNSYNLASELMHSPRSQGLRDVVDACCGGGRLNAEQLCLPNSTVCKNRMEYMFWDSYHPTEVVSNIWVNRFFSGPTSVISPLNIQGLVASP